jgi:predicted CXXCH cytochrome family protein
MRYIVVTLWLCGIILTGCSPEAKYKYLSIFVDGVPPPPQPVDEVVKGEEKQKTGVETGKVFPHGPYGAKLCTACHESTYSNKLLYPKEELCLHCHTFNMEVRWVHGPLAGGGCLICHDPHISRYRFLLVAKAEEFCFYCHDESLVLSGEEHEDAMQLGCTTCHDAHMSDRRFMLKEGVEHRGSSDTGERSLDN